MAESMQGLHRSHRCTEVNNTMIGNTVTVMGWVQKSRNKGGIIFVDLRDRSGILQVILKRQNAGQKASPRQRSYVPSSWQRLREPLQPEEEP